jgi:flagellar basal-body rod modification protein FlgD
MALWLDIKNGQITDEANAKKAYQSAGTGAQTAADKAKGNTSFDKNMFLKLLAAEMQYQDPLEPTQNSEYVSEMATFSQVEATQNVAGTVDSISAGNLIGKYVTVDTEDGMVTGIVDYTMKKEDKMYINVNGKDYDVDKVVSIKDSEYYEATMAASTFGNMMAQLPDKDHLTLENEKALVAVTNLYDSFSAYTKQFVAPADLAKLTELTERLGQLKNNQN